VLADRIAAGLTVAAFLFLCGVVYAGLTLPERPGETAYVLTIDAKARGSVIKAEGRSNLPDGARLMVYVDRLYRVRGSDIWSSARVGRGEAVVRNRRWEAEIPVDDAAWVEEVRRQVQERAIDPVETIHPAVRASVVFSPHVPQTEGVQARLGPNFEKLSDSERAVNVGDSWILSDFANVEMPIDRHLEQRLLSSAGGAQQGA